MVHPQRDQVSESLQTQTETTNKQLKLWKELSHELAACLGCGCQQQTGLCVQCHKANRKYRELNTPLQ